MTVRALVNVPAKARRGEVVAIKTLIQHPMETGYRVGLNGALIPRNIITTFVATYNGEEIFRADFSRAIAANPYLTFFTVATETGTIELSWTGDEGFSAREQAPITVE
jgi:sulfur-oxidizing protein SoxZ